MWLLCCCRGRASADLDCADMVTGVQKRRGGSSESRARVSEGKNRSSRRRESAVRSVVELHGLTAAEGCEGQGASGHG